MFAFCFDLKKASDDTALGPGTPGSLDGPSSGDLGEGSDCQEGLSFAERGDYRLGVLGGPGPRPPVCGRVRIRGILAL